MKLTSHQVKRLRALPLKGAPNKLRQARELAAVTQVELAAFLACEQAYISKVESGSLRGLPVQKARRFAKAFGCHIEDLFPETEAVSL